MIMMKTMKMGMIIALTIIMIIIIIWNDDDNDNNDNANDNESDNDSVKIIMIMKVINKTLYSLDTVNDSKEWCLENHGLLDGYPRLSHCHVHGQEEQVRIPMLHPVNVSTV
jgi:hypothetical protein